jgi:hypothetical protein
LEQDEICQCPKSHARRVKIAANCSNAQQVCFAVADVNINTDIELTSKHGNPGKYPVVKLEI